MPILTKKVSSVNCAIKLLQLKGIWENILKLFMRKSYYLYVTFVNKLTHALKVWGDIWCTFMTKYVQSVTYAIKVLVNLKLSKSISKGSTRRRKIINAHLVKNYFLIWKTCDYIMKDFIKNWKEFFMWRLWHEI